MIVAFYSTITIPRLRKKLCTFSMEPLNELYLFVVLALTIFSGYTVLIPETFCFVMRQSFSSQEYCPSQDLLNLA